MMVMYGGLVLILAAASGLMITSKRLGPFVLGSFFVVTAIVLCPILIQQHYWAWIGGVVATCFSVAIAKETRSLVRHRKRK